MCHSEGKKNEQNKWQGFSKEEEICGGESSLQSLHDEKRVLWVESGYTEGGKRDAHADISHVQPNLFVMDFQALRRKPHHISPTFYHQPLFPSYIFQIAFY